MDRVFVIIGALSALLAVGAGACGSHALQARLSADKLAVFEVGVRYQMYHALALLIVAWATTRWPGTLLTISGWAFVIGTILFSGSLYALSLTGMRRLGAITPIGGLLFLAGWLFLALAVV